MSLQKKHIIDVYSWRTKQLEVLGSINNLIDLVLNDRCTGCFELTVEDHVPEEIKVNEMCPSTLAMVVPLFGGSFPDVVYPGKLRTPVLTLRTTTDPQD